MPNGLIPVDASDEIYWWSSRLASEKKQSVREKIGSSDHFFLIQGHLLDECFGVRLPGWVDGLEMGNAEKRGRKNELHTRGKDLVRQSKKERERVWKI